MKPKEIQELISFIAESGLNEVQIETDSFKISVKRSGSTNETPIFTQAPIQSTVVQNLPTNTQKELVSESQSKEQEEVVVEVKDSKTIPITSPMIGTFYLTPNPDSPHFVNVGDTVKIGQVVCIIEAMKLFNEIESDVEGKVVKILVNNASPVEYGQALFLVQPL